MKTPRHIRELAQAAEGDGFEFIGWRHRAKHIEATFQKVGRQVSVMISSSPSCVRAQANTLAHLRRQIRVAVNDK
jgi:hypothetical protein